MVVEFEVGAFVYGVVQFTWLWLICLLFYAGFGASAAIGEAVQKTESTLGLLGWLVALSVTTAVMVAAVTLGVRLLLGWF